MDLGYSILIREKFPRLGPEIAAIFHSKGQTIFSKDVTNSNVTSYPIMSPRLKSDSGFSC